MNTLNYGETNLNQEKNQDLSRTKQQMLEDREVARLSEELGRLSEFEEQNKERMKEIAHILVQHYLHPNNNKDDLQRKKEKVE